MKIKKYISINRKLLLIYLKNPKLPGARDGAEVCLQRILQAQNVLKHTGFDTVDARSAVLELNQFKLKERSIRFLLITRQRSINFFLLTREKLKAAVLKLKESRKKKTDAVNDVVTPALSVPASDVLTNCITKDGQTVITANIPMASNKFTGLFVSDPFTKGM
jgi:hypothetical protein